ncbi:lysyl oxidase family protein [Amycolatopsis sp. H20-H5]|uniref:lysyl oxidase family protein n=1 Tax=Amycolatopsis sp. H20-H5 TaxID=3046309 RepID=UPI002DB8EC22|nr:lysyl oxidase family protein [Amycolatopsis sp. H20-H5]MEC3977330.1 lysyl oxidase family protein [Amycolatopsis sp. H20-H5]
MSVKRKYSAVAGVALALACTVSASRAEATTPLMLPDLRQAPIGCEGGYGGPPATCEAWDVCMVEDPSGPSGHCVTAPTAHAVRLRFTSSEENVGDGPLLLFAHRDDTGSPTMTVRQALQSGVDGPIPDGYGAAQRGTAAFTYYEPAKMHEHWHVMGFEHFALRTTGGETLVADRKNGFCLGDRFPLADADNLQYVPGGNGPASDLAAKLRENMCQHHQPSALDVMEGISVGAGDDYKYTVDFQWLDITHVPSGVYDLVNTVNADRTLIEKNYDNNSSSVAVSIQWPAGPPAAGAPITEGPKVRFVRSCPGKPSCA